MPLVDIQKRLRQIGRIRAGDKGPKGNPVKLNTWRLTSSQRAVIEQAASLWGGTVEQWESPNGAEWEVVTESDTLPVVIPTGQSISQWWESWTAAGASRRCDGERELLTDQPCLCDPDPELRECKPTTRISVMLPELSDLGQWRLDSRGWYAATELAGIADLLNLANAQYIKANLRLEQRQVKRPNQPVKKFAVPVIEMDVKLGDVLASLGLTGDTVALSAGEPEKALGAPAYEAQRPDPTDEEWAELTALLGPDVDPSRTMPELEKDLRRVFELMERVGLWLPNDRGEDALHQALRVKMDAEHVGDLNKGPLVEFCEMTWKGAREALAAMDEDDGTTD